MFYFFPVYVFYKIFFSVIGKLVSVISKLVFNTISLIGDIIFSVCISIFPRLFVSYSSS